MGLLPLKGVGGGVMKRTTNTPEQIVRKLRKDNWLVPEKNLENEMLREVAKGNW